MNDTFLSTASSTLQSICNQWASTYNESMESIESDSNIIQEKDELIEVSFLDSNKKVQLTLFLMRLK